MRGLRSDATRNREKALCAARRLFAERGSQVTMEEIAAAAGIGKGTLYRGYPSRAAVASAILDELARDLQARLLRGMDLPDAGPYAVLEAFLDALHGFVTDNLGLFCMAHDGAHDFRAMPAYVWQRHAVAGLLTAAARTGECAPVDVDAVPDAVLALVTPDLIRHQQAMAVAPAAARALIRDMLAGAVGRPSRAGAAAV